MRRVEAPGGGLIATRGGDEAAGLLGQQLDRRCEVGLPIALVGAEAEVNVGGHEGEDLKSKNEKLKTGDPQWGITDRGENEKRKAPRAGKTFRFSLFTFHFSFL